MHDSTYLESLMLEDDVRWVGEYAPFMRTTSDVLGSRIVHYVLASDVAPGNLAELSADFIRNGASNAWCSLDMCEALYDDGITPSQLQMSASHDDVLFVQQTFDLMLHNNLAATEVGAVAVRASSSLGLNGSGETIAIMDTGLDNDHPDIFGRVAPSIHNTGSIHHQLTATVAMVRTSLSQFWAMVVLMHQRQALPQRQTL